VTVTDERLLTPEHLAAITRRVHLSHERGDDAGPIAVDRRLLLQHIAALQREHAASAAQRDAADALAVTVSRVLDAIDQRISEAQSLGRISTPGTGYFPLRDALAAYRAALAQPDAARPAGEGA
jgi:hypothetical protein